MATFFAAYSIEPQQGDSIEMKKRAQIEELKEEEFMDFCFIL